MPIKLAIGQFWTGIGRCEGLGTFRIIRFDGTISKVHKIIDGFESTAEWLFRVVDASGYPTEIDFEANWMLVDIKLRHVKEIAGVPLDLSIPTLQAGHLQDRMIRRRK